MGRPPTAVWIAWAMTLAGGLALLAAAILVIRVDLGAGCVPGAGCATALSPATAILAFGGTGLAVVGGASSVALAVRGERRPVPSRRDVGAPR